MMKMIYTIIRWPDETRRISAVSNSFFFGGGGGGGGEAERGGGRTYIHTYIHTYVRTLILDHSLPDGQC